jgi:hypothetical protein
LNAKEYHIKIHSVSRFIIAFIITHSAIFSLLPDYIENQFLSILIFLGMLAISFYLSILFGQAKIKSVFTKEAFLHIWERRFLFSWEKDLIIPWKIVDSYVIEEDRTWDSFIINLSTEKRYKIRRLNIFIYKKDDFDELVKDLSRFSNEFKENGSDTSLNLITEGKSKYESKSFRQSLYILSTALLILCIIKIINSDSLTSLWSLGVIGSAIAYYWLMIKRK